MKTDLNRPIDELTKADLLNIKIICFDGDGVTKKKGTDFIREDGKLTLESHGPTEEIKDRLLKLSQHFHVTFSSGRAMDYLRDMYNEELMGDNGSLQAEIGMYLWWQGKEYQNFQLTSGQQEKMDKIRRELESLNNPEIKGFEPKRYLITLHCVKAVPEVEVIVKRNDPEGEIYCWWNEEAYDIGVKGINKGTGLLKLVEKLGLKMENVLTVGNGINDENMTDVVGIDISTDPKHLQADFVVWGEEEGGKIVVDKILSLV